MVSVREGGLLVRKQNRSWTFWSSQEKIREMDFGVGLCLSLDVWTRGFDKVDLRELSSSFLKRKESKVSGENSNLCLPVGIERLLGCLSWEKSRKKWGGAWWLHGQPSLGLWVCQHAWNFGFYMCWISIGAWKLEMCENIRDCLDPQFKLQFSWFYTNLILSVE